MAGRLIDDVKASEANGSYVLVCGSGAEGIPVCGSLSSLSSLSSGSSFSSLSLVSSALLSSILEISSSSLLSSLSSLSSRESSPSSEISSKESSRESSPSSEISSKESSRESSPSSEISSKESSRESSPSSEISSKESSRESSKEESSKKREESSKESSEKSEASEESQPPEPSNCRYVPCTSEEPSQESDKPEGSGDPPPGPGDGSSGESCVYSLCPSDTEQSPGPEPPPQSEESEKSCVYSICPSSADSSVKESSAESSAEESSAAATLCGEPGEGPPLLITLSWIGGDITKDWNGCTWKNGETKIVWPDLFDWKAFDDPYIAPNHNMFGGLQQWAWGGLSFFRSARGSTNAPFVPYTAGLAQAAAVSRGAINGAVIMGLATTRNINNVKQGYKWLGPSISTYPDDMGMHLPWSTSGFTLNGNIGMGKPNYGNELATGQNIDLNIPPPTAPAPPVGIVYGMLQGEYTDNQNNDPITISWTAVGVDDYWDEGSANGSLGEMGFEPEWQPMINPLPVAGPDACGTQLVPPAPTMFVTLSWGPSGSEPTFNIVDMQIVPGTPAQGSLLQVEVDANHNLSIGGKVRFQNTSTRQRIDGNDDVLKSFTVVGTPSPTIFTVDPNVVHGTALQILDPAAGTVTDLSVDTKSWLGCTWTNGETKEVYATFYKQYFTTKTFAFEGSHTWQVGAYDLGFKNNFQEGNPGPPVLFYFHTARLYLRTVNGSVLKDLFFATSASYGTNFASFLDLGILTTGDVPFVANPEINRANFMPNSYTDTNGVTYSWTEGNGW